MLPMVTHTPKSLCKPMPNVCITIKNGMGIINLYVVMFETNRCIKQKIFLCIVCHLLKEPVLTHWATSINLTAMHMHIYNNQQLQWQQPNLNNMATINMQIRIYTLPLLLTNVQYHI